MSELLSLFYCGCEVQYFSHPILSRVYVKHRKNLPVYVLAGKIYIHTSLYICQIHNYSADCLWALCVCLYRLYNPGKAASVYAVHTLSPNYSHCPGCVVTGSYDDWVVRRKICTSASCGACVCVCV